MLLPPMTDAELHKALGRLGVDRHSVRALPLLPLVQVAWADGRIQRAERGLIHEVATKYGLEGPGLALLDRWLARRPSDQSFLLARRVLLAMWSRDRERGDGPESLDGVIRMCMCVARVAGGLFGLAFTLDRRELALIGEISQSLQLGPTLSTAARQALPKVEDLPPSAPHVEELAHAQPTPRARGHRAHTPNEASQENTVILPAPDLGQAEAVHRDRNPTLTPLDDRDNAATVPLSDLRRELDEDLDTELDLPVLPHPYDGFLDD